MDPRYIPNINASVNTDADAATDACCEWALKLHAALDTQENVMTLKRIRHDQPHLKWQRLFSDNVRN